MIGENKNFVGGEGYLRSRGVEVVVLDDKDCTALMDKFIEEKPELWYVVNISTGGFFSFSFFLTSMAHLAIAVPPLNTLIIRNEDIGVEERVWSKGVDTANSS